MSYIWGPVDSLWSLGVFFRSTSNFNISLSDLMLKIGMKSETVFLSIFPLCIFISNFKDPTLSSGFFPLMGLECRSFVVVVQ